MSDIKYIIAGDVEEELGELRRRRCARRPFPCLAVVRYAVAGVVAVLAVTVISMVIRAMLRSEDIRLFVNNGYIGADRLWDTDAPLATTTEAVKFADAEPMGDADVEIPQANLAKGCYLGCSGGSGSTTITPNPPHTTQVTRVTMQAPTETNLRVILVVNNPGGRSKIDCSNTTVNISDAMKPYREIAGLVLSNFTVPQQTIITLQKRVKITNTAVLKYIWDKYIWDKYGTTTKPAFRVKVRVSTSVVSYPLGKMTEPKTQAYTCGSVTLGLVEDEASFANQVDCTADNDNQAAPPAP